MHLGFEDSAEVRLTVEPKLDFARSPEPCLNTVTLSYSGSSQWLSLEAFCSWSDVSGMSRFQLGIYAVPDRVVSGRAVLRLPRRDGGLVEGQFSAFELRPDERACNPSGPFAMPADVEFDRQREPQVMILFDTLQPLELRLDYLSLYFAA